MKLIHHPFALVGLEWMQDNSPELLREQFQEGILKEKIEKKVEQAINHEKFLINHENIDQETAREFALDMIAPADEIDLESNNHMSDKEFLIILNQLSGD